jgi:purine-binding chemotaxis protein CheW
MSNQAVYSEDTSLLDIVIFKVGDLLCGINILEVQEIKKLANITPVFKAPEYIRGVVNMRGQIVTLIDIKERFGMEKTESQKSFLSIIIPHQNELIGILVQNVEDIIRARKSLIDPPPSNMNGPKRQFINGILKLDQSLVAIINKDSIMSTTKHPEILSDHH